MGRLKGDKVPLIPPDLLKKMDVDVCVLWVVQLGRQKNEKRKRDGEERREKQRAGKGIWEMKGKQGNKGKKTKELINWFKCKGNRNRFWVFVRINDIYLYKTKLLMDIIQK